MTKIIKNATVLFLAGALLTGCGSQDAATDAATDTATDTTTDVTADVAADAAADDADTSNEVEVKKVLVGTGAGAKPYIYTDDNDEVIGYEAELIWAIDELLPEYEFEFEKTDFSSMFLGIDSGRYQMGANNITKKPEREEKYLFADEYDLYNYTVAIVRADDDSIKTLEDLGGKKVYTSGSGGFAQLFVETYNASHEDNPIITEYSDADSLKVYQDIVAGAVDFTLTEEVMFNSYTEEFPDLRESLKFVKFTDEETKQIQDPYGWFVYPKTEEGEALKAAVDKALIELKANGTVTEISEKYLGFDVAATE